MIFSWNTHARVSQVLDSRSMSKVLSSARTEGVTFSGTKEKQYEPETVGAIDDLKRISADSQCQFCKNPIPNDGDRAAAIVMKAQ